MRCYVTNLALRSFSWIRLHTTTSNEMSAAWVRLDIATCIWLGRTGSVEFTHF